MSRVQWPGSVLLAPVPVCLVTCEYNGIKNVFTVAWTGTVCTRPPMTYISVRPERFSYGLIKESGVFVVNLVTEQLVRAADWCGVKSGRDVDKFAELGLLIEKSPELGLPMISSSPLAMECRVREIIPLGSHDMFLADIVGISVDDRVVDDNGALNLEKADLAAYSHGSYYALGKNLGTFGFSVKKKRNGRNRKAK